MARLPKREEEIKRPEPLIEGFPFLLPVTTTDFMSLFTAVVKRLDEIIARLERIEKKLEKVGEAPP